MKRRLLSFVLVLCMLLAMVPVVTTEAAASGFTPAWPFTSVFHINCLDHYSSGGQHNGIDIAASKGTTVLAVEDGVVVQICNECPHENVVGDYCGSTWGNYVLLKHTIGGVIYYSRCAHLTQNSISVSVGSSVSKGQAIAQSGSSGSSSGPHLHLELYQGDRASDNA